MMAHPTPAALASITRISFVATAQQIFIREGYPGFFRGLAVCLVRAFPVNACSIFVYEGAMRSFSAEKVNDKIPSAQSSINHHFFECASDTSLDISFLSLQSHLV
jgi:hypothetical protein